MSFPWLILLFLLIHLVICIVVYLLLRFAVLRFSTQIMPMVAWIPVIGFVIAIFAEYNSRRNLTGSREMTLESLHARDDDYRLLTITDDEADDHIVPLEEAIIINDPNTRRKLMMDILHQNPGEYIDLLQQARLNDDIEVTHYASTAIMELQKDFEINLQKSEKKLQNAPEEETALRDCAMAYEQYIASGLINENIIVVHRRRYAELLQKLIACNPEEGNYLLSASNNDCELGNLAEARAFAERYIAKWPESERGWLQRIKIDARGGNAAGIQTALSEMKRRNIYLSPAGQDIAEFWDRKGTNA